MSLSSPEPGDVFYMTRWTAVSASEDGVLTVNASPPKGVKGVFLLLGESIDGKIVDPEEALRKLGYARKE